MRIGFKSLCTLKNCVEKEYHTYCANINSTKMWIKTPLKCGKTYSTRNVGKCFPRKCGDNQFSRNQ